MNRKRISKGPSSPVRASSSVPPTAEGSPATMPAKMISEMPLPMPRSVTCSPSHMRNMVPVTNVTVVVNTKPGPGFGTTGWPPNCWPCRAMATPMAWKVASPTVP